MSARGEQIVAGARDTARTPAAATAWSVEVRSDDEALTGLRAEWNDLVQRCAAATPFQSHAWLSSWWRTYGRPGRLRLVLVRRHGRLVAAGAFVRERRWLCSVLRPVGGALSDFTDILLDDAVAGQAAARMAAALRARRDWQVLDLPETRPDATAGRALLAAWPERRHWRLTASTCLELAATPMAELVDALPAHTRKTVRRRVNQLGRVALEVTRVGAEDAARGVAELLRLHASQWQGRPVNPEHLRPTFAEHLTGAVGPMIAAGEAALLEYRLDGSLVAANLLVIGPDLVGGYLYGTAPQLRDRLDVTTMLLATTLPVAVERGRSTMSMLRGAEPHKRRWRPREVVNQRLLLARPGSPRALLHVACVRLLHRLLAAARTHVPALRTVRDRARMLLRGRRGTAGTVSNADTRMVAQ